MDELVFTSTLVPSGCYMVAAPQKCFVDSDELSTAAPSPELACITSELEAWPSLRQAVEKEWDFCDDPEFFEDLPVPALPLPDDAETEDPVVSSTDHWWVVPSKTVTESATTKTPTVTKQEEVAPKMSYADMVRDEPWCGSQASAARARPVQRRSGATAAEEEKDDAPLEEELCVTQRHGWTNEHKASWNTKQLANQKRKINERRGTHAEE